MRTLFMLIPSLLFMANAQGQIFHENFENPDSVIATSSGVSQWAINTRLATSGIQSDSATIALPGETATLTTISFSTVGLDSVFLYFNQICKIEFFDSGIIEASIDGGVTWIKLQDDFGASTSTCYYKGMGLFVTQNSRFQEASYSSWLPGQVFSPNLGWYKREIFDVTTLLANQPDVKIRFVVSDNNNTGGAGRAGWFIDDILVNNTLNTDLTVFANKATGTVFFDANSNMVFDSTETPIILQKIKFPGQNNWVWTNSLGYYELPTNGIGIFNIQCDTTLLNNPDFSIVPFTQSANFTALYQVDSLNDFAVQPVGVKNDLKIEIRKMNGLANNLGGYQIFYQNTGNTILNPSITFYGDSTLTFNYCLISPTLISQDSIHWMLPSIGPFAMKAFSVYFNVPGNWFATGSYSANAVIYPLVGDFNPLDNFDSTIMNSSPGYPYDPNSIEVDQDTLTIAELSNSPFLEYTINFQNVGTDTATNVRIENLISSNLDLQTLEILGTSHTMDIHYISINNPRLLKFQFDNIFLPDSNIDEPASHGFITYIIKPISTLIAGDSIPNTADIYFDFNAPITTNTALTRIISPTALSDSPENDDSFFVYPNPATEILNISEIAKSEKPILIEIFNIYGQMVKSIYSQTSSGNGEIKIDVDDLPAGIYLIKLDNNINNGVKRFIKLQN